MKQSAARPKYQQPQLDNNRSLADQASASAPPRAMPKTSAKVTAIRPMPARPQPSGFWSQVPGGNLATLVLMLGIAAVGSAVGIPLGAWLFAHGVHL
ncbi:hypothetical protein [Pseudomonas sp. LRF_L74]|uniref:hypothetical protein n=1 Tax=Pseudomonas sp. LRF_L74 TaxID=3369422 RepID=UPI003F610F16